MTMDTTALSHQMFDQLFRQNRRQLFIVAFSYVRDEDVAQDIVNDSFMSLWERRGSIEPINLKAYLFRVVRNNCLHYRRDQQIGRTVCEKIRQKEAGLMEYYTRTIESCDPNELFTNEIIAICKEQVLQMPDITKQVFTLKTEGRSYKEIADILNISTKKVDKELQNATVKLRLSLKDYLSVLVIFFTLLEK